MKTFARLSTLVALSLLLGCSSSKVWYQAGKSTEDTQRQLAACRAEAARINNPLATVNMGFFIANNSNKDDFIKNCMMANGYSLVDKNLLPSGVTGVPK